MPTPETKRSKINRAIINEQSTFSSLVVVTTIQSTTCIARAFAILTGRLLYRHFCVRANEIAVAIVRGGVDASVRKV